MRIFYSLGIIAYSLAIKIASLFNEKALLWCKGRKNWYANISNTLQNNETRIWFHCASLGEFEQGRPLIEAFKSENLEFKIVLTFFSPSGFEVRKDYAGADYIFYLPVDTRLNANRFINLINPIKVFFVKYEYWYNYFKVLSNRNIPIYMVSAILRENHIFFKFYGGWYRKILSYVNYFFVQDQKTKSLLNKIGLNNVTITGDTRFDRVAQIAKNAPENNLVKDFVSGSKKVIVVGSSWQPDEELFAKIINTPLFSDVKIIIAPHEVHKKNIDRIKNLFNNNCCCYSEGSKESFPKVLIIDCIGVLSSLYRYGHFAYIGGAFGAGLHNILEAATFGLPVVFGPNYSKFNEAVDLIDLRGAFSISDFDSFSEILSLLILDEELLNHTSSISKDYVQNKQGSVQKIMQFLK